MAEVAPPAYAEMRDQAARNPQRCVLSIARRLQLELLKGERREAEAPNFHCSVLLSH